MKIRPDAHQEFWLNWLSRLAKRPTLVMLVFFLAYNIVLAAIAISLFYTEVPYKRREQIVADIASLVRFERFNAGRKARHVSIQHLQKLSIDLQPPDHKVLIDSRALAVKRTSFYRDRKKSVPAVIRYKNESREVNISLNLQPQEFWTPTETWCMEVEINDVDTLTDLKRFFVFSPELRAYSTEWLFQQLIRHAGLSGRQDELVAMEFGGEHPRISVLKEPLKQQLENNKKGRGALLRFSANIFEVDDFFDNDGLPAQFEVSLEAFFRKEADVKTIFNVDKLATYFALNDLWGNCRPALMETVDFYFDPANSLLEPVFSSGRSPDALEKSGVLGAERLMGNGNRPKLGDRWLAPDSWYNLVFADPVFYTAYIKALEELANGEFLDTFLKKHQLTFREIQGMLDGVEPPLTGDPIVWLIQNKLFIRRTLLPYRQIYPYFNREKTAGRELVLEIVNIHYLPVEILGANTLNSVTLTLNEPVVLQASSLYGPAGGVLVKFNLPEQISWADSMLTGLSVRYRIPGSKRVVTETVFPYSFSYEKLSTGDIVRQKSNLASFDFLEIDEKMRQVRIKSGHHRLTKSLIIPKGYKVIAGKGVSIDLVNGSNIVSYSPLLWTGSDDQPVYIFSSDSTGQGITVIDASGESSFRHVRFENLSAPDQNGWNPDGVVTFYQSRAKVSDCQFGNNRKGETYLNFVRTHFAMDNVIFTNAHADAIRSDFSTGEIRNTKFFNSGRIAMVVVGSRVGLEKISVDRVGGTGISAGGKSQVEGSGLVIKAAKTAVVSKDLSEITLKDIRIEDSKLGYAAFQDRDEFGPASIVVKENASFTGTKEIEYLIESGSSIMVSGQPVATHGDLIDIRKRIHEVKNGKTN